MNGGYKIISFAGYPLTVGAETPVTIPGLHAALTASDKATLVEKLALVIDGDTVDIDAFFATFITGEAGLSCVFYNGTMGMTVTDEDAVTVYAITTGGEDGGE